MADTAENQRQARFAREARNILNASPEMNPACWGNKMDPVWYVWGSSKVLEGYRQIRKAVKLLTREYYCEGRRICGVEQTRSAG